MPLESTLQTSFHLLAFKLLGIEGLPLPRINWHLQEGQDGYDDPYLTDEDHQALCNIVCHLNRLRGGLGKIFTEQRVDRQVSKIIAKLF